jgi:hypothetical protein
MGRDARSGRLEPVYGRSVGALGPVDNHHVYLLGPR